MLASVPPTIKETDVNAQFDTFFSTASPKTVEILILLNANSLYSLHSDKKKKNEWKVLSFPAKQKVFPLLDFFQCTLHSELLIIIVKQNNIQKQNITSCTDTRWYWLACSSCSWLYYCWTAYNLYQSIISTNYVVSLSFTKIILHRNAVRYFFAFTRLSSTSCAWIA